MLDACGIHGKLIYSALSGVKPAIWGWEKAIAKSNTQMEVTLALGGRLGMYGPQASLLVSAMG